MSSSPPNAETSEISPKKIIVMAPSGTLGDFDEEYGLIDQQARQAFPDANVIWTYASEAIRKRLPPDEQARLAPRNVFGRLQKMEGALGVVQSLHIIEGGEFGRLAGEASVLPAGWSLGRPLIRNEADFDEMTDFIRELRGRFADMDGLVLVGHGAKAPHGLLYEKLAEKIAQDFGSSVLFGVLTGCPARASVMRIIKQEGLKTLRLIPFLFSIGSHIRSDIMEGAQSWKRELEAMGISVTATPYGLSRYPRIADMIVRRLRSALHENSDSSMALQPIAPQSMRKFDCDL